MGVSRISLLALAFAAPACTSLQGIETVRPTLTALNDAATAAQAHVDASSDAAARSWRTAYLTQSATNGPLKHFIEGEETPDGPSEAVEPGLADVAFAESGSMEESQGQTTGMLSVATALLCDAQRQRLAGQIEVRGVSELASNTRSFDIETAPETIIENAALLASSGRTPRAPPAGESGQERRVEVDPYGVATEGEGQGAGDVDANQTVFSRCAADVRAASTGRVLEGLEGGEEAGVGALLDLAGVLDTALRAQAVTLLQILARAQRLDDLRDYLRENKEDIDRLRASLDALEEPMIQRTLVLRRLAAQDYLIAFDRFRADLEELEPAAPHPLAVSRGFDLASVDTSAALLDEAAAYDDAMSEGAVEAFADLEQAIAHLQEIADNPTNAASRAAALRATMSFIGSLRSLAEATENAEVRRALDTAFPPPRRREPTPTDEAPEEGEEEED